MIHGSVTLDEVFSAAWARAASLVPETSGYLALAVGDATSRLPFAVDGRLVMLTTEGSVSITKRGEMLTPAAAAKGLRAILARLLAVSTGTAMPSLSAAARPREESDRGVDTVIEEIEAALIPVNRSAARRALARLVRETIKARESGKLRRPSTRPPPEAPRPAVAVAQAKPAVTAVVARPAVAAAPPPVAPPKAPSLAIAAPAPPIAAAAPPAPPTAIAAPVPTVAAAPPRALAAPPLPRVAPPPLAPPPDRAVVAAPPLAMAAPALVTVPVLTPVPEPVVAALAVARVATPAPAVVAVPDLLESHAPAQGEGERGGEVCGPEPFVLLTTMTPRPGDFGDPVDEISLPLEVHRDPTPTWLGMAAVEMDPEVHTSPDVVIEDVPIEPDLPAPAASLAEEILVDVDPEPTALPESTVLGQPTEDPAVAFEMVRRVDRPLEALTPPFPFEVAPPPRGLPVARPAPAPPPVSVEPRPAPAIPREMVPARSTRPTRADDLLAHFGASCVDDASMREAAACLRHIAGIDPTPAPARVELRLTAQPAPAPAAATFSADWETPAAPRARRRSGSAGAALSLTLAALVVGAAGAGAVVRFRPDLVAVLLRAPVPGHAAVPAAVVREVPALAAPPVAPFAASPLPAAPLPAAPLAATAEPAGVALPGYGERLGGTRAERGSGQRAR